MPDIFSEMNSPSDLERFQLGESLGEGADMQVFSATDLETGDDCVVKRPHPSLISRNIHDDVERRVSLQTGLRAEEIGIAGLPRLLAVTVPDGFEWYFGDNLKHTYSVQVEERAAGIPLLGSIGDQVRGHSVGLPFNLFTLHPSTEHLERNIENPSLAALRVIERCFDLGYLAGDLGPRNLFYSPGTGDVTVIDLGSLRRPVLAGRRNRAFDLNDILFEFFQFYATPDSLPTSHEGFTQVREQEHSGTLERMALSMSEMYSTASDTGQRDAAEAILERISRRSYQSVADFHSDFQTYLSVAASRPRNDATDKVWSHALERLRETYWAKYLFDADLDLSLYSSAVGDELSGMI